MGPGLGLCGAQALWAQAPGPWARACKLFNLNILQTVGQKKGIQSTLQEGTELDWPMLEDTTREKGKNEISQWQPSEAGTGSEAPKTPSDQGKQDQKEDASSQH